MKTLILSFLTIFLCISCGVQLNSKKYDVIILNGKLLVPDGEVKKGHVLIKDNRIAEIIFSDRQNIDNFKAKVKIDAKNKFVMPGLIDAHAHFISVGRNASNLDLLGISTWKETLEKVKERVANAEPGECIIGRGWHQEKWTDAPIEKINPFRNIYAALTRKSANYTDAFYPSQILTRKQALKMYTQGNAYAEFKENEKGKLEKGFLADIVILDRNLMECPVEDIPDTKVILTMVDGEIKYLTK